MPERENISKMKPSKVTLDVTYLQETKWKEKEVVSGKKNVVVNGGDIQGGGGKGKEEVRIWRGREHNGRERVMLRDGGVTASKSDVAPYTPPP